jgi:hypothetical protein
VKKGVKRGLMVLGVLLAASLVAGVVLGLSDGEGSGSGAEDKRERQRWVVAYYRQLERWQADAPKTEAAAKRGDFQAVGRTVKRMGRDGNSVRRRFSKVPADLSDGDKLYKLLVDAGDAASEWARIYRVDPPPYDSSARGLRKAQTLSDAAVDFQQKANRAAAAIE